MRIKKPPEYRVQPHHFKIGTTHNSGAHFAGIAQADHGESDCRKVADLTQGFHAGAQIQNFRYREVGVLDADPRRALPDINQAILVSIDEGPQQHASNQRKDSRVRTDTQRQREHHRDRQALSAPQRPECDSQVLKKQFWFRKHRSLSLQYSVISASGVSSAKESPSAAGLPASTTPARAPHPNT